MAITVPKSDPKLQFGFLGRIAFSLLPLSPESAGRRKTIFTEVVPGKVWTMDQVGNLIIFLPQKSFFEASFERDELLISTVFV